jgi:hypothetical protein
MYFEVDPMISSANNVDDTIPNSFGFQWKYRYKLLDFYMTNEFKTFKKKN